MRRTVNGYDMDRFPSPEVGPLDNLIAAESVPPSNRIPTVLLWGKGTWPYAGQSREPVGPEPGRDPRGGIRASIAVCGGCEGIIKPGHHCLVCDRPKGTLVARTRAAVVRRAYVGGKGGLGGKVSAG